MYDKWNFGTKNNLKAQIVVQSPAIEENTSNEAPEATEQAYEYHSEPVDLIEQYYKEIRKAPLLTKEEEIHYTRRLRQGDEAARQQSGSFLSRREAAPRSRRDR